ncbi:MAG: hypothetical protein M3133_01985 [Actinomycetota bacterium]|nr:hypothetical protein [Actinomycetota bacterium]
MPGLRPHATELLAEPKGYLFIRGMQAWKVPAGPGLAVFVQAPLSTDDEQAAVDAVREGTSSVRPALVAATGTFSYRPYLPGEPLVIGRVKERLDVFALESVPGRTKQGFDHPGVLAKWRGPGDPALMGEWGAVATDG